MLEDKTEDLVDDHEGFDVDPGEYNSQQMEDEFLLTKTEGTIKFNSNAMST